MTMTTRRARNRSPSFSSRIASYFGALFLGAMGVLFALWYFGLPQFGLPGASDQRLIDATRALEHSADLHQAAILSGIGERRGDMLIVAEGRAIAQQLADDEPTLSSDFERVAQRLMRAYPDRYLQLLIVDPLTGGIRASSERAEVGRPFADKELIARAARPGITELIEQLATPTGTAIAIVRQIHDLTAEGHTYGRLVGVLIGVLDTRALVAERLGNEAQENSQSGTAMLFDFVGQPVAGQSVQSTPATAWRLNPQVQPGFEGTLQEDDGQGTARVAVYRHLPLSGTQGWTLVRTMNNDKALAGLKENARWLVGAGLLLAAASLLLITLSARRLSRPMRALAGKARRLGEGDLSVRVPTLSGEPREVTEIAEAFNGMAHNVELAHHTLEQRVLQRTAELATERNRAQGYLDIAAIMLLALDSQGRIVMINRRGAELLGRREGELLGADWIEQFVPQAERAQARKVFRRLMAGGVQTVSHLEGHVLNAAGEEIVMAWNNTAVRDDSGAIVGTLSSAEDVTLRRQVEQQIRLSEENLRITLQSIGDAVIATDASGLVTRMNATAQRLTGWPVQEALHQPLPTVFRIINALTREPCANPVQRVMERGEIVGLANHTALIARDGSEYQISDSAAPIRDTRGQIIGVVLVFSDVTDSYLAEAALRESERQTQALIQAMPDIIFTNSSDGTYLAVHAPDSRLLPAPPQDYIGRKLEEMLPPKVAKSFRDAYSLALQSHTLCELDYSLTVHGKLMHFEARVVPLSERQLISIVRDISERRRSEEALRIAATTFESQEGITVTDAQQVILRVNKAFSEITGYSADEVVGKTPNLLSSGRHDSAFYTAMWDSIASTGAWQGEIWNRRKSGEVFPEWLTITAVKDPSGSTTHFVATFIDITLRKTAEDQITNLAFYDPLTHLPNRRLLLDRLEQVLAAGSRHRRKGALLFVDLDNFKALNDTLGHYQGDLLLQQVGKRLSACIREGDTVARLGGDEFVVMLQDLREEAAEAAAQAEHVGEKILAALNQGYQLGAHEHHSTPSIGITLFGGDVHEGVDEPLKRADLAMYQAKAAGRNTLRFFEPQMQAVVSARAALESSLRKAVENSEFELHYQAQVTDTQQPTGCEVLVRWRHPQRGLVSPAEFIPLAEETGLIVPLGAWVLEAACQRLAAWALRADLRHLTIAVNVSARQFHRADFVDQVLGVLQRTGANPQRLKLELTESLLVQNLDSVIAKMNALRAVGVGFSLDDFGTGYSSLSYLKRLPLDQLKIDRSFVHDLLTDASDAAISKTIIALGYSLGLEVIAEGVETTGQRDYLLTHGCRAFQGYLFCRPMPIEPFENYLLGV